MDSYANNKGVLFNTSLVVFTYLMANIEISAIDMSSWSYISIFAFLFVKIVPQRKQLVRLIVST